MQLTSMEIQTLQQIAAKAGGELAAKQEATIIGLNGRIQDLQNDLDDTRRGRDQLLQRVEALETELKQARNKVQICESVIKIQNFSRSTLPAHRYCRHDGGNVYEYLGTAKGAGASREHTVEVYRSLHDNRLYFRTPADFTERMTVVS